MTLALAHTAHSIPPNAIDNTISSFDSANSPTWRLSNLVAGSLSTTTVVSNQSDIGYNPYSRRFGFIRNNFAVIYEYSEADIVNGVATPTLIREVTITGLGANIDTEGLTNVYPNLAEGGFEFWASTENAGLNRIINVPMTIAEIYGTTNISIPARQLLDVGPNSPGTNDGAEGVDFHPGTNQLLVVQEGATVVKDIFLMDRPIERDANLTYLDAGLTVTQPFNVEAIVTGDMSSCCFHPPTGHILILSHTADAVYQYTMDGTLIDTLILTELTQPEGICLHGDNLVVMGEPNESIYYTYTVT